MMRLFRKKPVNFEESREYLKLVKEFKKNKTWLFDNPQEVLLDKNNPPVLIYQMGKVASTTVFHTLKRNKIPNPIYKIHQLNRKGIEWNLKDIKQRMKKNLGNNQLDNKRKAFNHLRFKYSIRQIENHKLFRETIDKNLEKIPWKIITLVRDPIKRQISNFFFSFHKHPGLMDEKGQIVKKKAVEIAKDNLIENFASFQDWALRWFDEELKEVFSIDVYGHPFDPEKGYTIIQAENISVLVLKLEKLNQCFGSAISEFMEGKVSKLIDENRADQKFYSDAYKYVVDNITLDVGFCEEIYSSKFMKHFFSSREIENLISKWTRDKKK